MFSVRCNSYLNIFITHFKCLNSTHRSQTVNARFEKTFYLHCDINKNKYECSVIHIYLKMTRKSLQENLIGHVRNKDFLPLTVKITLINI